MIILYLSRNLDEDKNSHSCDTLDIQVKHFLSVFVIYLFNSFIGKKNPKQRKERFLEKKPLSFIKIASLCVL